MNRFCEAAYPSQQLVSQMHSDYMDVSGTLPEPGAGIFLAILRLVDLYILCMGALHVHLRTPEDDIRQV
jgi:hypothetical protein